MPKVNFKSSHNLNFHWDMILWKKKNFPLEDNFQEETPLHSYKWTHSYLNLVLLCIVWWSLDKHAMPVLPKFRRTYLQINKFQNFKRRAFWVSRIVQVAATFFFFFFKSWQSRKFPLTSIMTKRFPLTSVKRKITCPATHFPDKNTLWLEGKGDTTFDILQRHQRS